MTDYPNAETAAADEGRHGPGDRSFAHRLESIDLLRGLVMALMALDHTRAFFSNAGFDPLDLSKTSAALFLTRWITHFCAPVFIFIAGISVYLRRDRVDGLSSLSRDLALRGALLIVLELTVIRWIGWNFGLQMNAIWAGVLWAIGWSMVALAGLVWLPRRWIGFGALAMIVLHNAFDRVDAAVFGSLGWLWQVLHAGGGFEYWPGFRFTAGYPLIPWIGVMAAGYAFGPLFTDSPERRRRLLLRWGSVAAVAFVLLRAGNLYGDGRPWSAGASDVFTLLSFLNCVKYPPSLLYLLMTLGPALWLLAAFDRGIPRLMLPLLVFGRVPLFFYLLHLPLIHGLAAWVDFGRYGHAEWRFGWPLTAGELPAPEGSGFGLLIVYLVTLFVLALLYPCCRWFADFERNRR